MFAMIDKVFFTVVKGGITGLSASFKAEFADHNVFVGKPQTQAIGLSLDECDIELVFHYTHGSVQKRIDKLKRLLDAQEPVPFVMGNSRFVGVFTLRELNEKSLKRDDRGGLLSADVSVKLKEYAGEMPSGSPLSGIVGNVLGALGVSEDAINMINNAIDTVQTAISIMNDVLDIIEDVTEVIGSLKTSSNPLFDLLALGGVLADGEAYCSEVLGFGFPNRAIFESFKGNVDLTGACFGDILGLSNKAEASGDITPYLSPLLALSDNLTTQSNRLPVDMAYLKVEIAGRDI